MADSEHEKMIAEVDTLLCDYCNPTPPSFKSLDEREEFLKDLNTWICGELDEVIHRRNKLKALALEIQRTRAPK